MREDAAAIRAQVLGTCTLEVGGVPVQQWRAGRARQLFQYLLINREQPASRERLHEALWPAASPPSSSSLKVAAHAVRRILEEYGAGQVALVHSAGGYMIEGGPIHVDLDEFNKWIDRARAAKRSNQHQETLRCYANAVNLYRGDLLEEEPEEWIESPRRWARNYALWMLSELRVEAFAAGEWIDGLRWCERTLALDPVNEPTYQALVSLYGEQGEVSIANYWYEACCQALARHLGVEPSDQTKRLCARIQQRSPIAEPVAKPI